MNSVYISGRAGQDMKKYDKCVRFSLAVWKGKDKEGNDRGSDWFNVVCFKPLMDKVDVSKGDEVIVEGKLLSSKDKDNKQQVTIGANLVKVVAHSQKGSSSSSPSAPSERQPDDDVPDSQGDTQAEDIDIPFD